MARCGVFAALLFVGCSSSTPAARPRDVPDAGGPPNGVPDAVAEPLPAEGPGAFTPDFATSTAFFTRMAGRRQGLANSPHNLVQIWYSANLRPLVTRSQFTAPTGTVAIKVQDRDADGVADNIMVMIKQAAGFDPMYGDWSYEQRDVDGTLQASGRIAFCSGCHAGFPATDGLPGVVLRDP